MAESRVNGTTLFWTEAGGPASGTPLFVLHGGLGFDHTYMRAAFDPVADVARVVYVDQRGNGRSGRPPHSTITIRQLADDVAALASALGHDRFGVAGHSFGGFVSLQLAVTVPQRLDRLVLLCTSPGVFQPTPAELAERGDRSWVGARTQAALDRLFATSPATDEEMAAMLPLVAPAYLRRSDPSVLVQAVAGTIFSATAMRAGFESLEGWSVADRLGAVACPTFVACGRHDLLTTPECSRRLATAIPGARLAWFEESGHFPWIEEPDPFHAALRSFLAGTARAG